MPKAHQRKLLFVVLALTGLFLLTARLPAQSIDDPLAQGFKQPDDAARPRTWWHWTSSNVTREGITKDLEWMKRAGIAASCAWCG